MRKTCLEFPVDLIENTKNYEFSPCVLSNNDDISLENIRTDVVIATKGRANTLSKIIQSLDLQTRTPHSVIVSCHSLDDAGDVANRPGIKLVLGLAGLPRQRNAGLREIDSRTDIVIFFDDDFLAHPGWIEAVERSFIRNPDVVAISGHVVADGIHGPGFTFEEAVERLAVWNNNDADWIKEDYSPYGCNMAFRRSAIRGLLFDERLVLYGWLEDRDFGGALKRRGGRLIQIGSASGVHLGAKTGRVSGRRLGYSQVVNPIYLYQKGTMSCASVALHLFRNITSNLIRSLGPANHIDRIGRLRGNILGLKDIFFGLATPERAEQI